MSSSPNPTLRIDWCSYDAARYAVEHWHYSRSLPCSKTARLGVWEDGKFIGAIVFAWGANRHLVSYADLNQGHEGKIYQASNWLYVGMTGYEAGITLNGKLTHRRTINSKYGTSDIEWLRKRIDPCATRYEGKPKFKYLLPLDDDIAERIKSLSKHYPDTRATSDTSDTPGVHPGKGRAARTVALQH